MRRKWRRITDERAFGSPDFFLRKPMGAPGFIGRVTTAYSNYSIPPRGAHIAIETSKAIPVVGLLTLQRLKHPVRR